MAGTFKSIKEFILSHKIYLLFALYFLSRLINLTKLPIFNDEAIYLNWGWIETHKPGFLYYSLYDGKQPFLMWIFGIFQIIMPDPLLAGRFVSVIAGFLSLLGIYKIADKYLNKRIAFFSLFLYIISPIFLFFDRQTLMESSIGATGIWSLYFLINLIENKTLKNSIALGLSLGLGFFIKSSAIIFIIAACLINFVNIIRNNEKNSFKSFLVMLASILIINTLLIINPEFWSSFPKNSSYGFSLLEILRFPVSTWLSNFFNNTEIIFFYITPFIFILAMTGIYLLMRNQKQIRLIAIWIVLIIILETLLTKETRTRYIVAFLPPLCLTAASVIDKISAKTSQYKYLLYLLFFLIPLVFSSLQIIDPILYINLTAKFSRFAEISYLGGWTSGIGIKEAVDYLKKQTEGKKAYLTTALNTGNPESAISVYFEKNKNTTVLFLDQRLFKDPLEKYDCLKFDRPVYFIARDKQQAGLDKFLIEEASFKNPFSNYSIVIYKIREKCRGKSLNIFMK